MLILANMGPKGHTKVRLIFNPEFVTYWGAKRWGGISRQEMVKDIDFVVTYFLNDPIFTNLVVKDVQRHVTYIFFKRR